MPPSTHTAALTASLPQVVYMTVSGSEANDLAWRVAAAVARRADPGDARPLHVACVDHAYHGHTSFCIEISPYKFKVGAEGQEQLCAAPHVRSTARAAACLINQARHRRMRRLTNIRLSCSAAGPRRRRPAGARARAALPRRVPRPEPGRPGRGTRRHRDSRGIGRPLGCLLLRVHPELRRTGGWLGASMGWTVGGWVGASGHGKVGSACHRQRLGPGAAHGLRRQCTCSALQLLPACCSCFPCSVR